MTVRHLRLKHNLEHRLISEAMFNTMKEYMQMSGTTWQYRDYNHYLAHEVHKLQRKEEYNKENGGKK